MNHRTGFNALSRTTAHRRAMLRNMVTSLFRFERITTTKAKAKEARRKAEKLVTRAKVDSVHNRREVAKYIADEKILNKLFTDIAREVFVRRFPLFVFGIAEDHAAQFGSKGVFVFAGEL